MMMTVLCVNRPKKYARWATARRKIEGGLCGVKDLFQTTAWDPAGVFKREIETYPFIRLHRDYELGDFKQRCEVCRRESHLKWRLELYGKQ